MRYRYVRDSYGEIVLPGDLVAYNDFGNVVVGRVRTVNDMGWSTFGVTPRKVSVFVDRLDNSGNVINTSHIRNPQKLCVIG